MILILTFSTIIFLYVLMLAALRAGLSKWTGKPYCGESNVPVSVIIALRNERENLPGLLNDLKSQEVSFDWEVVMVDDHSEDDSVEYILKHGSPGVKLLRQKAGEQGKKSALTKALAHASHPKLIQTDADCRFGPHWLQSMSEPLTQNDLVIGMVKMKPKGRFWSRFAALEFLSLQASGMSLALLGKPIMGNAANLAYRKSLAQKFGKQGHEYASGDDVFLIQAVQRNGGRITLQTNSESFVETAAPDNFWSFLQQRLRWGGKTTGYTSSLAVAVALLVALSNISIVAGLAIAFVLPWWWNTVILAWLLKSVADFILMHKFARLSGQERLLRIFPVATFLYPFYITLTVILLPFVASTWKGRKISPYPGF